MYSIDINFLKDRPEYQGSVGKASSTTTGPGKQVNYSKTPIYIGVGAGVLAMLVTGIGWLLLDQQAKTLQAQQTELDRQLGQLKTQESELASLKNQIGNTEGESKALAGVFNSVRPWSAILQEFRESIPQGVQIQTIGQIANAPAPAVAGAKNPSANGGGLIAKVAAPPPDPGAKPSASPSTDPTVAPSPATTVSSAVMDTPAIKLKVAGVAQSFNDVNNFVLTLKKSAFLNPDETQLINANLATEGTNIPGAATTITKSVKYEIQTALKQVPASELLQDLERKGAVGLVTRLKSLQQQQVIKP
jgi:type IV pilus assembly protein PilN